MPDHVLHADAAPGPLSGPETSGVVETSTPRTKSKSKATSSISAPEPQPLDLSLAPHLEALLISLDRPIKALRVAQALGLLPEDDQTSEHGSAQGDDEARPSVIASTKTLDALIAHLNEQYAQSGRSFRIEKLSAGYRVMTIPEYSGTLARFHAARGHAKLTRAAIETLAIIAYKQPMTRAELEAIRGVSCGEVLKTLLERRMVTVKGRAEELGRPMLYGTTRQFLDQFGLASIKDLPQPGELKLPAGADPSA